MSCEPKVINWKDVEAKEVPESMATKTTIRWLIEPKDAPNFCMRIFEVMPGGVIKEHSHPWEHEIFVLKGKGKIRIGKEEYEVKEGDFIYIPPCKEHYYENLGDEPFTFICVIPKDGCK